VAEASGGRRVLVIDDVKEMRVLIHRALSASGYMVDVAATLAQARHMDPGGYDAVLVDAGLGADSGVDLVEALRAEDPAAAGRCLMMTGGAGDAIPAGVAYLAKPFQLDDLLDAVRALHQPSAALASGQATGIGQNAEIQPPVLALPNGGQPPTAEPQAWRLFRLIRRLRARERHELVDFLHDGPIQELTAATLELQVMSRAEPSYPAERFAAVQRRLDAAAQSLRWLVDGDWPMTTPETWLDEALRQRTAWLLATPAIVHPDLPAAGLAATEVPVVVDVVELMLLGILPADPVQAQVAVRIEGDEIEIELTLTAASGAEQPVSPPGTARTALVELASALGAVMRADFSSSHCRARIVLPRQATTTA
jgi:DNA-binding response OmpR family regulator